MRFYLEKRVLAGFILALAILSWLGYNSFLNNKDLVATNEMIAHTNEVLYHIEQSQSTAFELESLLLKYVISGDSIFLDQYKKQLTKGSDHVRKIREGIAGNPVQQKYLEDLRSLGSKKVSFNQQVIQARKIAIENAVTMIPSEQNGALQDTLINLLVAMKSHEQNLLNERIGLVEEKNIRFNSSLSLLLAIVLVLLVSVFITINKSLKARMLAEEQTNQLNKELEAFTYSVSHDLRAPLRSVDGYAKVLYEDYGNKLDEEGHRVINVIMNNAKKMGHLIDDLLEFSRIGRKELQKSKLDMRMLVDGILHDYFKYHSPLITIHELAVSRGDQNMIRQVWMNLISNAIKYSQKNQHPQIEIGSFKKDNEVVYYIKDNGVGFDMQYVHKLFGVFQRLHKASDFEGTGVGLALVYRIIKKHNGNVWGEAELNKGATFYFSLPA